MKNMLFRITTFTILSSIIYFFTGLHVFSQNIKEYSGYYQPLIGHSGIANFFYSIDKNGNKIKEGPFTFTTKISDSLNGSHLEIISWKGQFKNDLRFGEWVYWDNANTFKITDIHNDFSIEYHLHSIKKEIQANYTDDLPQGEWKLQSTEYKDGIKQRKIEEIQVTLDKSKFINKVSFFGPIDSIRNFSITGETKSGLMVGEWKYTYYLDSTEILEIRHLRKGFLESLLKVNVATGDTIVHLTYPLSEQIRTFLDSTQSDFDATNEPMSLTFSDGYPRNSIYILEQKKGNEFIEKALSELFKFDPDFIKENGLPMGTNRMRYMLNSKEKQLLKTWAEIEFRYRDKVSNLNELLLENYRYEDNDSLTMAREWMNKQNEIIAYIKPWNNIISLNEIEYYNREGILYEYAKGLLEVDSFYIKDHTEYIYYKTSNSAEQNFLFYVTDNFDKRIKIADSLYEKFEKIITELKLADNVKEINDKIILQKDAVDYLYNNIDQRNSKETELLLSIKKKVLEEEFKRDYLKFIKHANSSDQFEMGKSILFNLIHIETSYYSTYKIFATAKLIDTLYTEYIFDPYTYNDRFPKRVKKKLYQTAAEDLFSYFISEAINAASVSDLEVAINKINRLHERLVFLRDKDTNKLEKQLKKKKSVNERIELLKID